MEDWDITPKVPTVLKHLAKHMPGVKADDLTIQGKELLYHCRKSKSDLNLPTVQHPPGFQQLSQK
uniref:Uncharacterized protein n=1 Tax=Varanus komodoensis TaxID=61221 RepID=A0A8D2LUA9_VARKO